VYTVIEKQNAYVVRLEMPRRIPASALKETWGVGDEMPDYHYSLQLEDQVLSIRASVEQEAIRRLAYISSSFPPDFLTRIEFAQAVEGFVHRLTNKVLEIIVFKRGAIRS
jgi:HSP20 family molecular chaperone IbpA